LKKKISSGSFGDVYLGQNIKNQEYYAIKVEKIEADSSLSIEREVYIKNSFNAGSNFKTPERYSTGSQIDMVWEGKRR